MKKDDFAKQLGFFNWKRLMDATVVKYQDINCSWFVTQLPDGYWAHWDNIQLNPQHVYVFDTLEEAENKCRESYQDFLDILSIDYGSGLKFKLRKSKAFRVFAEITQGPPLIIRLYAKLQGKTPEEYLNQINQGKFKR
ncbi:hypothetical protein C8J48_3750 [Desmospora activa DSM 45169]|uniref:Uncharacterized protein n=1 Tax=Desmospora activa DSM 45169 TaxID=1121389 RepID=A0A2T4YZ19_9BACL|nr:hypothetical protein C8J48_3750 [Desmospora activa DSM 45169]